LIFSQSILSQHVGTNKQGGICFRVDDNQSIDNWRQYSAVFEKYRYNFTFAVNAALFEKNPQYVGLVQELIQSGHELADHTPNHNTLFFTTDAPNDYINRAGVDHIFSNTIVLKYDSFDTSKQYSGDGNADLISNMIISKKNGAFKDVTNPNYAAIYLPTRGLLVSFSKFSNADTSNVDTLYLTTFWGEPISLSNEQNIPIKLIGIYDIRMNIDALSLLAERSLTAYSKLGITRPVTWIQPGGAFPQINSQEAKTAFGDRWSYRSAAVYPDASLKCYNEYDPLGNRRYAMMWGDFMEDENSFDLVKRIIADRIAKHYCAIGHSHFSSLLGDWNGYLIRMDSLLSWCKEKNVTVKTYKDWAEQLYSTPQNPYTNIFPPLNVDLDGDGKPDGYTVPTDYAGVLDIKDGVAESGNISYSVQKAGDICSVEDLSGLEKGENDFYIWTKGSPGDSVELAFTFPANSYDDVKLKFPATSSTWSKYGVAQSVNGTTSFSIPVDVSICTIRISCSSYAGGTVKVSGFELRKKINDPLKIVSMPDTVAYAGSVYIYQLQVAAQYYNDTLRYDKIEAPGWLNLTQSGTLRGTVPADTGINIVQLRVQDRHGNFDVQIFHIQIAKKKPSIRIVSMPDTLITPRLNFQYKIIVYSEHLTDSLNYSIIEAPDWLKINSSGILFGIAPDEIKTYSVKIEVNNQRGDRIEQFFYLYVQPILIDNFEYADSPLNHGWVVAGGAGTVTTQFDTLLKSRVLNSQTDQGTDFRIDRPGNWYSPTFSMQFCASSNFILYVRIVDSVGNIVTMQYTPDDGQPSKSSSYCFFHIGKEYKDGVWNLIARDLDSDLVSTNWGSGFMAITTFMVRGSFFMDDLTVGTVNIPTSGKPGTSPTNVATNYQLQQNYPNPFNPATTIKYSIVSKSIVSLSVYNMLGQRIKTIEDGVVHENGFYYAVWNGEDEKGRKVSSGIYFYRLNATQLSGSHQYAAAGKMVLLK
jgi:hypothetical protein